MAKDKTVKTKVPRDRFLPKLTTLFFDRPRLTAILWLAVTLFGLASYTTLLKREGFPSVNIPLNIVTGTYFANDPAKVNSEVAKPIAEQALKQGGISGVRTNSAANFFTVEIQYDEGVDAKASAAKLEEAVKGLKLPPTASVTYNVPYFGATGGDAEQIDLAISFYATDNKASTADLAAKAEAAATWLKSKKLALVQDVFVKNPLETVTDPATGQPVTVQQNFDQYGLRQGEETKFYNSVLIGVAKNSGADVIQLDDQVRKAIDELKQQPQFQGFDAEVSASFAPSIKDNISELQRVLLEGLLAVLVVGSIVIAIRASIITVISMVTVLLISLGFMYLIGYSLNVITLFALILGLSLIVDDTIIMVEAIDAARRRDQDARKAVYDATRKVSRAMVAATLTACLSFAPLLFVGGILGSFIRAIPVTIIASLLISLLVALIFIPFFARFLLLGKKQMGKMGVKEVAAGFEAKVAHFIARPMLWARHSRRKLFFVGILALVVGFGFIGAGLAISKNVVFNIFPPTKDTNGVAVTLQFPAGTSIEQAQAIATKADQVTADVIGNNFVQASYYNTGSAQNGMMQVELTPYGKRDIHSPEIVTQLQEKFDKDFPDAKAVVAQIDLGPPAAAFIVQLKADNRAAAFKAADDLAAYMRATELKRLSGKVAHMKNVTVSSQDQYMLVSETDNDKLKPVITVTADFDGTDTSTLVTLAKDTVSKEFNDEKLASYGLKAGDLTVDLGQESENQDSFKTLAIAFPIMLLAIYILLLIEFRSFLQPLLIFMAIPFSIFGIMLGLDLTNNPISFFALLGFFALVGLSIKNTILLTDFANQARRSGLGAVDSAVAALEERFRPLFATSVTAVVSLIPLAISSPFWQGLTVVLICGLLSSTFLVIVVFPYYYLGVEYLRLTVRPLSFFIWAIITAMVAVGVGKLTSPAMGALIVPLSLVAVLLQDFFKHRLARR